jgi:hypothetical protein
VRVVLWWLGIRVDLEEGKRRGSKRVVMVELVDEELWRERNASVRSRMSERIV